MPDPRPAGPEESPERSRRGDDLTALVPSFLRHLRAEGKSPHTILSYEVGIRQFLAFLRAQGMPTGAAAIARAHVEAFILDVAARRAPNTVAARYRALRRLFGWLLEEGEIARHPMERMREPAIPETPPAVLTVDELARLLKACAGTDHDARRDEAIVRLFAETGLRRDELASLRLVDLRLDDGIALVHGKGSRVRYAAFGPKTGRALDRYLRARARHPHAGSDRLWLGKRGPLGGAGIYQALGRRAEAAGIAGFHPHRLRHSFAHRFLSAGGQEGDLMHLAGWRSRRMLDRYGQSLAQERAIEAARRLGLGEEL